MDRTAELEAQSAVQADDWTKGEAKRFGEGASWS
jgi:hypothetical protein